MEETRSWLISDGEFERCLMARLILSWWPGIHKEPPRQKQVLVAGGPSPL